MLPCSLVSVGRGDLRVVTGQVPQALGRSASGDADRASPGPWHGCRRHATAPRRRTRRAVRRIGHRSRRSAPTADRCASVSSVRASQSSATRRYATGTSRHPTRHFAANSNEHPEARPRRHPIRHVIRHLRPRGGALHCSPAPEPSIAIGHPPTLEPARTWPRSRAVVRWAIMATRARLYSRACPKGQPITPLCPLRGEAPPYSPRLPVRSVVGERETTGQDNSATRRPRPGSSSARASCPPSSSPWPCRASAAVLARRSPSGSPRRTPSRSAAGSPAGRTRAPAGCG